MNNDDLLETNKIDHIVNNKNIENKPILEPKIFNKKRKTILYIKIIRTNKVIEWKIKS